MELSFDFQVPLSTETDKCVKGELGRAKNIRIESDCQVGRIYGDLCGADAQVKRVLVRRRQEFILADGHERAVQRFYLYPRQFSEKRKVTLRIWVWTRRSG